VKGLSSAAIAITGVNSISKPTTALFIHFLIAFTLSPMSNGEISCRLDMVHKPFAARAPLLQIHPTDL
jgi:hypothetical protein